MNMAKSGWEINRKPGVRSRIFERSVSVAASLDVVSPDAFSRFAALSLLTSLILVAVFVVGVDSVGGDVDSWALAVSAE